MKLRPQTVFFLSAAVASTALVAYDPWVSEVSRNPVANSGAVSKRLFPILGERSSANATIELTQPNGEILRFVPREGGVHNVVSGDKVLGPVESEAFEGLWASLRMAMTVRAVPPKTDAGIGEGGSIRVVFPDTSARLSLGRETADKSGVYGDLGTESGGVWVVENELAALMAQRDGQWLDHRLLQLDPRELSAVAFNGLSLGRGADDIWRVEKGAPAAILSNVGVERRLSSIFNAQLNPMIEREAASMTLRPWLVATMRDGSARQLALGGICPANESRQLIARGPGLLGCIEKSYLGEWDFQTSESGLLESRLVPYAYGRVLEVEQTVPSHQRLKRKAGGWLIEQDGGQVTREVSEPEVFRWYGRLRGLEVDLGAEFDESDSKLVDNFQPTTEFVVKTDSTQNLHIRCQTGEAWVCTRDGGTPRRVVGDEGFVLGFDQSTFIDRSLTSISPSDIVEIEILPGSTSTVRQSARLDLGVWTLDAPPHPPGALDMVRVESLLSVMAGARAQRWVDAENVPKGEPLRVIRLGLRAGEGRQASVEIRLFDNCVVQVDDGRHAELGKQVCAVAAGDILFNDPLRFWLDRAKTIDLESDAGRRRFRREGESWVASADPLPTDVAAQFEDWRSWRVERLVTGEPNSARLFRVITRGEQDVVTSFEIGAGWVRLVGSGWYYQFTLPSEL